MAESQHLGPEPGVGAETDEHKVNEEANERVREGQKHRSGDAGSFRSFADLRREEATGLRGGWSEVAVRSDGEWFTAHRPGRNQLRKLAKQFADGQLQVPVASRYRLADSVLALAQAAGGHAGGAIGSPSDQPGENRRPGPPSAKHARRRSRHVQHIYDKIGVSTRGAAALYAMENELV